MTKMLIKLTDKDLDTPLYVETTEIAVLEPFLIDYVYSSTKVHLKQYKVENLHVRESPEQIVRIINGEE